MQGREIRWLALLLLLPIAACGAPLPDPEPSAAGEADVVTSDPRAVVLAERVLDRLGGREAWEQTRYVTWDFFGARRHVWDRWTGDIRVEKDRRVVLMNLRTREGRIFDEGSEVTGLEARERGLEEAYAWWINDSYWMFMPFKLLDPGTRLAYHGEAPMEDGRPAEVLDLTFDEGVGLTPRNRYEVFVATDTGLVEQWNFYADAGDDEPRFKIPWGGWQRFGNIWLSTTKGRGKDWRIAVFDELPPEVFHSPRPLGF